ncbi:hypothetical protein DXB25_08735 [Lachnospiraceae bacterium OM02-31]|jgi:hypothetical protein|nr:hypothetical protein DXB25_08735 [Lachnospiraceae bacterium OM02-31]RJW56504.1 hypothetical protein DXB24_15355 [Lachnospiraceae bacterium OM02-3]
MTAGQSGVFSEKKRRIFVFCQEKLFFLKKIKGFRVLTQNIKDSELIFVRKRDRIRVSFPAYSD